MNDNLADTPAGMEHPALRDVHGSPPSGPANRSAEAEHGRREPAGATAIWLAIYLLTAVLTAAGAVLIARAVNATGMETATAGGATFLAVLTLAISAHRFLRGR
jgi:hypothetical protein